MHQNLCLIESAFKAYPEEMWHSGAASALQGGDASFLVTEVSCCAWKGANRIPALKVSA